MDEISFLAVQVVGIAVVVLAYPFHGLLLGNLAALQLQMQVLAFARNTKGTWILRFAGILADSPELGPSQNNDISLLQEALALLAENTPKGDPNDLLPKNFAEFKNSCGICKHKITI